MAPSPKDAPCFCRRACVYHLLRCDACHRGVHFTCIQMTLAEASAKTFYICPACQDTAQEDNLVERLKADGKPGAVVFTTICTQHNPKTGHRRGTSTKSAFAREKEIELSTNRCHICDHRCNFEQILCDKCEAGCHFACAKMTPQLAERIEKWYCRRCLKKDPALQIVDAEESNDSVPPQKPMDNAHQGFRPSKRRFELVDADAHAEKRARVDAKRSSVENDEEPQSADEELYLNFEEEDEKLFLDLEGED